MTRLRVAGVKKANKNAPEQGAARDNSVVVRTHSMHLLRCYHKHLALIGPVQTTSSTGGFDFINLHMH